MNIQRFLTLILLLSGLTTLSPVMAQACIPPSVGDPGAFSGVILSIAPSDGVRALRPELQTTYYVAFDGANFTAGGAASPDGRYYAVPNGSIQTNSTADVRYVVQEIRVITTEIVPRILARIPWQASFPVGTRFATTQGVPVIQWLDAQTLAFPSGSMNGAQTWQRIDFSASPADIQPFEAAGFAPLSPDMRRGLKPDALGWAIYDIETTSQLEHLPRLSAAQFMAWSPDSSRLATLINSADGTALTLFWRGGAQALAVVSVEAGQTIWNVHWSPNAAQLAYALYDPEINRSRLYLYDVQADLSADTCLDLLPQPQAVAWSPDGAKLAVLTETRGESALYAFDPAVSSLSRLSPYSGGLLGWFVGASQPD